MPKWVRKGECSNCGYCCIFSFDPVGVFIPNPNVDKRELLEVRGFKESENEGVKGLMKFAEVYLPCPQHQNNRCAIYDHRPHLCQTFPETPSQITNTPCSYWFEDETGEQLPIGGDGSPHGKNFENYRILQKLRPEPRQEDPSKI